MKKYTGDIAFSTQTIFVSECPFRIDGKIAAERYKVAFEEYKTTFTKVQYPLRLGRSIRETPAIQSTPYHPNCDIDLKLTTPVVQIFGFGSKILKTLSLGDLELPAHYELRGPRNGQILFNEGYDVAASGSIHREVEDVRFQINFTDKGFKIAINGTLSPLYIYDEFKDDISAKFSVEFIIPLEFIPEILDFPASYNERFKEKYGL